MVQKAKSLFKLIWHMGPHCDIQVACQNHASLEIERNQRPPTPPSPEITCWLLGLANQQGLAFQHDCEIHCQSEFSSHFVFLNSQVWENMNLADQTGKSELLLRKACLQCHSFCCAGALQCKDLLCMNEPFSSTPPHQCWSDAPTGCH